MIVKTVFILEDNDNFNDALNLASMMDLHLSTWATADIESWRKFRRENWANKNGE